MHDPGLRIQSAIQQQIDTSLPEYASEDGILLHLPTSSYGSLHQQEERHNGSLITAHLDSRVAAVVMGSYRQLMIYLEEIVLTWNKMLHARSSSSLLFAETRSMNAPWMLYGWLNELYPDVLRGI